MIVYFPPIYPDELIYSQFARYYAKSGYLAYTHAAQDLFSVKTVKPDIEFINALHPEVLHHLTHKTSMDKFILNHTMFPYYARFISRERKQSSFHALLSMTGNYRNLLPIPANRARYLRHCPLCAGNDRDAYGETYWHRIHQLPGIQICPIHRCQLVNSSVAISSDGSPSLITAEETVVLPTKTNYSDNQTENILASYIMDVFLTLIDFQTDIAIGQFLHSKLEGTKYLSQRGNKRNMEQLFSDFSAFYRTIPNHPIQQQWQLGKIFSNSRHNLYEICMVAMFLNVSPSELTRPTLPDKPQATLFDETILDLHSQGLNYQQIAFKMNASYDLVKAIGEKRYGTYHYLSSSPMKGGSKKRDWNQIDQQRLPVVKEAIFKLQNSATDRPKRITIGMIERYLGLPKKGLQQCTLCLAEIQKYYEPQEVYWVREVIWAVQKCHAANMPLNITRILHMTNLRKHNLLACLPYLVQTLSTGNTQYVSTVLALFQENKP